MATLVERPRRRRRKQKLLGSHQRCWIWGKHPVVEALTAGKWLPLAVHLSEALTEQELAANRALAGRWNIETIIESPDELWKRCHSSEHQGYLAKMPPFPYDDAETVLSKLAALPLCAILDGIQDPYNFGAILRSADALGVQAVFVGTTHQADVTSLVARSSAGAVNHIPIAQVDELVELVNALQQRGIRVVAASEKAEYSVDAYDFREPTAIVIGNEGRGVRPDIIAACDSQVRIEQTGNVASLNAAVSAGILFYEARRQRSRGQAPI